MYQKAHSVQLILFLPMYFDCVLAYRGGKVIAYMGWE